MCNGTKESCNLGSRPFQLIHILAQGYTRHPTCHLPSGCIFFGCTEGEGREDGTRKFVGRISAHPAAKPRIPFGLNFFLQEGAFLKLLSTFGNHRTEKKAEFKTKNQNKKLLAL